MTAAAAMTAADDDDDDGGLEDVLPHLIRVLRLRLLVASSPHDP